MLTGVDFISDEIEKDITADKPEPEAEEVVEKEEPKISYGRKKPKRGLSKSKDETSEEKETVVEKKEDIEEGKDSYSVKSMNFGRSKRKK
jgi:hypothetical protein